MTEKTSRKGLYIAVAVIAVCMHASLLLRRSFKGFNSKSVNVHSFECAHPNG